MQYKFVVDGEWRHDDRQPSISSNLGTVNTILLTRESDFHPPMLTPQMPSVGPGSSMDVDNAVWHCLSLSCVFCFLIFFPSLQIII